MRKKTCKKPIRAFNALAVVKIITKKNVNEIITSKRKQFQVNITVKLLS